MAKQKIEPGMQVRVGRAHYHGIKFGAVCRVLRVYGDGDCDVSGPVMPNDDWSLFQNVAQSLCKPIKRKG